MISFDVNQAEWGSSKIYDDDPSFAPRFIVLHWGGSTGQIAPAKEAYRLKLWQRYHLGKGWKDIAYSYAVGDSGTVYRLRGMNPGGHVKCSVDMTPEGDSYCDASVGIVWLGGKSDANGPSRAAKDSISRIILESGLVPKGHRTVKIENNSWTECPGNDWLSFLVNREWEDNNGGPRMSDAPNISEALPHQVASWEKAWNKGIINTYTKPQAPLVKGDLMVFLDRLGLLDA